MFSIIITFLMFDIGSKHKSFSIYLFYYLGNKALYTINLYTFFSDLLYFCSEHSVYECTHA